MTLQTVDVVDDLHAAVRGVLDHDRFAAQVREAVSAGLSDEARDRVTAMAERTRASILAQVEQIPVREELHWTLALSYMELKAQWLSRQVRICYEEMITGTCDREAAAEGSVVSSVLQLIEPLMDARHLREIESLFVTQTAD